MSYPNPNPSAPIARAIGRHRVYAPIACPYVLSVRDPYAREPAGRWRPLGEFADVILARKAARSLRRFWPWVAVRITYPPVGD